MFIHLVEYSLSDFEDFKHFEKNLVVKLETCRHYEESIIYLVEIKNYPTENSIFTLNAIKNLLHFKITCRYGKYCLAN